MSPTASSPDASAPPARPRNLHIAHSWGGGLARWVRDFAARDRHADNLVLASRSTESAYGLAFELVEGRGGAVLERRVMDWPICETAIEHSEYAAMLAGILDRYGIEHLYVSTFVGHSLDVLDTSRPTTVVFHDYYPFCVGINLHFREVCATCGPGELEACLAGNALSAPFRHNSAAYRVRLRDAYFRRLARPGLQLVCPSPSVVANLRRVDARFRPLPLHRIAHGADVAGRDCFGGAEEGRRLRLVVLGQLSPPKGLAVLRGLFPRLQVLADLYLLGASDRARDFAARAAVTVVERYEESELTDRLERIRPDLALFLSVVPESFSYTLSEAWAHRIPVCAHPVGSFLDRIRAGENGFWLPPDADRAIAFLLRLDEDRARLRDVHRALAGHVERPVRAMIDEYYALRAGSPPVAAAAP